MQAGSQLEQLDSSRVDAVSGIHDLSVSQTAMPIRVFISCLLEKQCLGDKKEPVISMRLDLASRVISCKAAAYSPIALYKLQAS